MKPFNNITCRSTGPRMVPYSEGALSQREREHIAAHLTRCAACRAQYDDLTKLAALFQSAPPTPQEPSADLWARLQSEIAPEAEARRSRRSGGVRRIGVWTGVPGGALAAAAVVAFALMTKNDRVSRVTPVRLASSAVPVPASPVRRDARADAQASARAAARVVGVADRSMMPKEDNDPFASSAIGSATVVKPRPAKLAIVVHSAFSSAHVRTIRRIASESGHSPTRLAVVHGAVSTPALVASDFGGVAKAGFSGGLAASGGLSSHQPSGVLPQIRVPQPRDGQTVASIPQGRDADAVALSSTTAANVPAFSNSAPLFRPSIAARGEGNEGSSVSAAAAPVVVEDAAYAREAPQAVSMAEMAGQARRQRGLFSYSAH